MCDKGIRQVVTELSQALLPLASGQAGVAPAQVGPSPLLLLMKLNAEISRINGDLRHLDMSTFRTIRDALQQVGDSLPRLPLEDRQSVLYEKELIERRLDRSTVDVPASLVPNTP